MNEDNLQLGVNAVLAAYKEQIDILTSQVVTLRAQLIQVHSDNESDDDSGEEKADK